MTVDPTFANIALSVPESWSSFGYATGDPVNYNDPTGLKCDDAEKASLLANINRWIYGDADYDTSGGEKGLYRRWSEQINGKYAPGTSQWDTHNDIIEGLEDTLRGFLQQWNKDDCGPPPPGAWKWASKGPVPDEAYKRPSDLFQTAKVALLTVPVILQMMQQYQYTLLDQFIDALRRPTPPPLVPPMSLGYNLP